MSDPDPAARLEQRNQVAEQPGRGAEAVKCLQREDRVETARLDRYSARDVALKRGNALAHAGPHRPPVALGGADPQVQ
ncbi:MAG: hypothetical protein IPJ56_02935 [Gemmatimonadetes bacterium]|nr:hypothetical protein [Gemmatimonadota bacterium]